MPEEQSVQPGERASGEVISASGVDDTESIQTAISKTHDGKKGIIYLPAGRYFIRNLTLKSGVSLQGAGRGATVLEAIPSDHPALITIDPGPVLHAGISRLSLRGGVDGEATNPEQWAVAFAATPESEGKAHGGLWWSKIEEVSVIDFDRGLNFSGGQSDYMLPHQFVTIRDVNILMGHLSPGPHLKLEGQVNQFLFQQVYLDARERCGGCAVQLLQSASAITSPKLHHFDTVTIQNVSRAVEMKGAHNVTFTNCWFENVGEGLVVEDGSTGVTITGCRFANVGGLGAGLKFASGTVGRAVGNVFAGAQTNHGIHVADEAAVESEGNTAIWGAAL
ncbi:right-handed parallel beta-helix repeat-containing protein [Geminicoccus harenae]|uniref:right-handed parallel beta-helix repeat-containing protein n=1 Tax=Geminicoccus harenae TaxID=2498453 RepID=UPI001C95CB19|nr:right-handed parallel beta-helix repeat-containing protein [Geminicoccus harenae]